MVTVTEALDIISAIVTATREQRNCSLEQALDHVLAESIYSPINMPPFRQSAMDGYALSMHESLTYHVVGEVAAGSSQNPNLKPGEAVRIFTGAPVPDSTNSIVIQEKVTRKDEVLALDDAPQEGANIRPVGEQLSKGDVVLAQGTRLSPASLGLLAGVGVSAVPVHKKPRVAIVVTGDELKAAGEELSRGQIYESNGLMLRAALKDKAYADTFVLKAEDKLDNLTKTLEKAFETADVVLVSGGISVGDYDFVNEALSHLGVKTHFYKVKQKPGKPLLFGTKDQRMVFALPGNPASALNCFYVYVHLALKLWEGDAEARISFRQATITADFNKKGDRAQFLKAKIGANNTVEILNGQASSMLQSFAVADALVYMEEDMGFVAKNTSVRYLKID